MLGVQMKQERLPLGQVNLMTATTSLYNVYCLQVIYHCCCNKITIDFSDVSGSRKEDGAFLLIGLSLLC